MANKILIIDDDLYIRDLYDEVFKDAGFTVTTAIDGKDGLEKIKQGGFDTILLDVMMPKLDGLGVLTELQTNPPAAPNGPIILLTNLAHDQVIKEALTKGVKGYLIKADLNPDELVQKVKSLAGLQ